MITVHLSLEHQFSTVCFSSALNSDPHSICRAFNALKVATCVHALSFAIWMVKLGKVAITIELY